MKLYRLFQNAKTFPSRSNQEGGVLAYRTNLIRDYCSWLLESQKHLVTINSEKIAPFAQKLKTKAATNGGLSTSGLKAELIRELCFATVNFCFTHPATGKRITYQDSEEKISGSRAFFAYLNSWVANWNSPLEISRLPLKEWLSVFPENQHHKIYLLEERWKRFTGFARILDENTTKQDEEELFRMCSNGERLMDFLTSTPYFEDFFLKRAQVAAHNIHYILQKHATPGLSGYEYLTAMADYRLPQLFINCGIIELCQKALLMKLKRGTSLVSNSSEEVILRAATVDIVYQIAQSLGWYEADVDSACWMLASELETIGELTIPHHRVATCCY